MINVLGLHVVTKKVTRAILAQILTDDLVLYILVHKKIRKNEIFYVK